MLAIPNTEPVVASAAVLGSLIETAREEAEVPVGFLAAITKGQRGEELTAMGELARAGAAGFTRACAAPPPVPRPPRPPPRRPLRGAHALAERPDARGTGVGRAWLRRLPLG